MPIESFPPPSGEGGPATSVGAADLLHLEATRALLETLPEENAGKRVWKYFLALSETPRPSHKLEQVHARLLDIAARLGCLAKRDAADNIVLVAEASPDLAGSATVAIQAHMDMVCSANEGTQHNFDTDPINVYLDGDKLRAKGTTLGADDGIGVAAGLAILEEAQQGTWPHPRIELLVTANEETDMSGAELLDPGMVSASTLINVDSEEEGKVCFGCAGGFEKQLTIPIHRTALGYLPPGTWKLVRVLGGKGGHTGININDAIANGIRCLARILRATLGDGVALRLGTLEGGTAVNSIPREAKALVFVEGAGAWAAAEARLREHFAPVAVDYKTTDPELSLTVADGEAVAAGALTTADTARVLDVLRALPHGVVRMSPDVKGLPETSVSLSIVELQPSQLFCHLFARSSSATQMATYARDLESLAALIGAQISGDMGAFPGWLPNPASKALATVVEVYKSLRDGQEPTAYAVHAGLECGFFLKAFPQLDCVSIGPQINGAHSPDEELIVSSVPFFYLLLKQSIARLSGPQ